VTSDYSVGDPLVLDVPSRLAQAQKIGRLLEQFAQARGVGLRQMTGVDIGCSSGIVTCALAPRFASLIGVDVDRGALMLVEQNREANNVSFVAATGRALPFGDGAIDVVVCNQVYQYVPDVPRLLAEVGRVLHAGGFCYFSARTLWGVLAKENRLPFINSFSPRLAQVLERTAPSNWRHRAGKLWPYTRLRRLAEQHFTVHDYTLRVLTDSTLSDLFVPPWARGILAHTPSALLAPFKPLLPTHIWVLEKHA
jgi:ubiquinone/menaquinone biosynthesis C-methylase UbiE